MKSLLFVVCSLVAVAFSGGPIDGVYETQQNGCQSLAEARYLSFLFLSGACGEEDPMVFLGKYDISPSDPNAMSGTMSITYTSMFVQSTQSTQPKSNWTSSARTGLPIHSASVGGNGMQLGVQYILFWTKWGNQLNFTSPVFNDLFIQYTRQPYTKVDGTWLWSNNGYEVNVELNAGLMLTLSYSSETSTPVMGIYHLTPGNNINFYYVYGPPGLAGTTAAGNYSFNGMALNMDVCVKASGQCTDLIGGLPGTPYKEVEGVWTGASVWPPNNQSTDGTFCLTTVEFHNSFWRGFQTGCSTDGFSFGTYFGTFSLNNGFIELMYGLVDQNGQGDNGLQGQTLTFQYDVTTSNLGGQTQLVISQPSDPQLPVMTLVLM